MKKQILTAFLLSAVALTAWAGSPNVIFIMTDDQGYGDLGCTGHPVIKTPHLDRLAGEAVQLRDFHVHTFCSPTRAALMSGLNPARTGVTMTTTRKDILRTDVPTMADYFKASGYQTALFGKWHIGDGCRYSPGYRGFEETLPVPGGGPGTIGDYWRNAKFNDTMLRNGKWVRYKGCTADVLFTEAMRYIETVRKDSPFFIYLPTFAPHNPRNVPKEWTDSYPSVRGDLADFCATVSRIDYNVGRLRAFLKERKLDENTILVFTTDNGSSCKESVKMHNGGHRGTKGSLEEHGHRVPCFIHWPKGGLDKKREVSALTAHMDWLPTFIDWCHLKKPALPGLPFDGISLAPLLTGGEKSSDPKWSNRVVVLHNKSRSAIMKGRWRLLNGKLSNLDDDPRQERDVAGKHPELVAALEKHSKAFKADIATTAWKSLRPIYVGETSSEPLTFRTPAFWQQGHILTGKKHRPTWPVHFLHTGTYEIEFRRWAPELNQPLDATLTVEPHEAVLLAGRPVYVNRTGPRGKALPIHSVKVIVAGKVQQAKAQPGQTKITLRFSATKGPATIKAMFLDSNGNDITAPYYSHIKQVHKK